MNHEHITTDFVKRAELELILNQKVGDAAEELPVWGLACVRRKGKNRSPMQMNTSHSMPEYAIRDESLRRRLR